MTDFEFPDTAGNMDRNIYKNFRFFINKVMGLQNAPFQNELDDVLSDYFYKKIVVAFSRDHGKSTHLSVGYPLWEIAKNHDLRILLVSSSAQISISFMTQIIANIESNPIYQKWATSIDPTGKGVVPQIRGTSKGKQKWSGNSVIIDREDLNLKDPTINGVGLFGSILSKRADIIIIDDLVNQVNSMTEAQREKVIDWFYTTVLPVLVPGGRCIYLGNTWHQDDLVSRMMKDPQFEYRKKRAAIIKESDHPELWERWRDILLDETYEAKMRVNMAEDFYQANKAAMDEGVEVLWKERYSYKDLYLKRVANPYAFERMYQCDPSNRPNQKIRDEWIEEAFRKGAKYKLQSAPHEGITVSISCSGLDLAISEEASADDTVLLTLDKVQYGVDEIKGGDFIIRNIRRGKMSPNEVKEMVKNHSINDRPQGIRVETVGYQKAIQRDLEDMSIQVTGYHTGGEKNDADIGVNSLAVLLENKRLIIPSDHTDHNTGKLVSQLANEMRAYPDGHTGDALMALWFAYSEIRDRTSTDVVIPGAYSKMKESVDISNPEVRKVEEKKADVAMTLEQEYERSVFNSMMRRR